MSTSSDGRPALVPLPPVGRYLLPNEVHVATFRQHPVLLLQPAAVGLGGILAAIIVARVPHEPRFAKVVALTLAAFLIVRAIYVADNWAVTFVTLTSSRLMLASGFFKRRIVSVDWQDLRYCTFERSFGGRLVGYGEITIESGGRRHTILDFLTYPEQIYLLINGITSPELARMPESEDAAGGD